MYAIIATGGKQYKVSEGDIIRVEKLGKADGEAVTFDQVIALNDGELKVGTPTVTGASVSASVLKEGKAKKVIVYKYKPKKGHHKKNGHRQQFTEVKIEKIRNVSRKKGYVSVEMVVSYSGKVRTVTELFSESDFELAMSNKSYHI